MPEVLCDLRFWSPRRDSNPRPSDYESENLRPAGTSQARSGCSGQRGRLLSSFLTCRVMAGGMTKRMTRPTHGTHSRPWRASDRDRRQHLQTGSPAAAVARSRSATSRHRIGWHAAALGHLRCHGDGPWFHVGGRRLGRDLDSVPAGVLGLVERLVGAGDEFFGGLVSVPGGHPG